MGAAPYRKGQVLHSVFAAALGFNEHVKEAVPRLVDRLTNAGFVLDPSNITKASS